VVLSLPRGTTKAAYKHTDTATMQTDTPTLGWLIKDRRVDVGLTQEQLAERVNVSNSTISAWERGARIPDSPATFARLVAALEIEKKTPEYTALRAAWTSPDAPITHAPAPSDEGVDAQQEAQGGADVSFVPQISPGSDGPVHPERKAVLWVARTPVGQVTLGLAVLLAATLGSIVVGHVLAFPRLFPGFVKGVAVATTCESPRCAVYQAQVSQIYQQNVSLRQVYGIADLADQNGGRRCAITPAAVSASILQCGGCRVFSDGLDHKYTFMIFTIDVGHVQSWKAGTRLHWLRVDYYANGDSSTSSGSGAVPAWARPYRC